MASERMMPGPEGRVPRLYEVEKGQKTESYLVAVSGRRDKEGHNNPLTASLAPTAEELPIAAYKTDVDKVRIEDGALTRQNIGLTLAELEHVKDDPYWRRIRWSLFILFWVLWIIMFILAILIVALSASCPPKHIPEWWQVKVAYKAWVPSYQDLDGDGLGDVKGMTSRLDKLRKLGVQTMWATPLLDSDQFNMAIRDYRNISSRLGTADDMEQFITTAKDKGMYVVMDLPLATTSRQHPWFYNSARASLPEYASFKSYYRWNKQRPNERFWAEERNTGVYYQHFLDKPDVPILNWQNQAVRDELFDVIAYWMDQGINGFHLEHIDYLARKEDGSEPNWPDIYDILRDIRFHVETKKNETESIRDPISLFTSLEDASEQRKTELLTETGLNLVIHYELGRVRTQKTGGSTPKNGKEGVRTACNDPASGLAYCVNHIISDILAMHKANPTITAMWEFGNAHLSRLASRVDGRSQAELLTLLQFMLPGANSFYYGDEIGMQDLPADSIEYPQRGAMLWNDEDFAGFTTNATAGEKLVHEDYKNINFKKEWDLSVSPAKMFKRMSALRKKETLMIGQTYITDTRNSDNAFALARYRYDTDTNSTLGNTYVAILNFGTTAAKVNLTSIPHLTAERLSNSMVRAFSSNVDKYERRDEVDLSSSDGMYDIEAEQGIVFAIA